MKQSIGREAAVEESARYEAAKKRVEEIKGLYMHIGMFAVINLALFAINMITNPDTLWFYWPLLGWGVGVVIHVFVFVAEGRLLSPQWEDKKVRELMRRDDESLRKGA
jgi:hypothetical protein